ncbi:MAG: extensin family protein [Byssovorax sp.]
MRRVLLALGLALLSVAPPGRAEARPNRYAVEPLNVESTPAFRYAAMASDACLAELGRRGVPFTSLGPPPKPGTAHPPYPRGVETPIRLAGPIRGVRFRHADPAIQEPLVLESVADCRLALALDDLAYILRQYAVTEVHYLSIYRPGWTPPGVRHPAGRAIDVARVRFGDGSFFDVKQDFYGRIGAKTCGEGAAPPVKDTPGSRFFRRVVCELDAGRPFNLVLTPQHDWAHRDHLHLEVRSGIRWQLIQ